MKNKNSNKIKKVLNTDISPYFKKDISPFFKQEIKLRRAKETKKKLVARKKKQTKNQNNFLIILVIVFLICGFLWGAFYGQDLLYRAKSGLLKIGILSVSQEIVEKILPLPLIGETEYRAPSKNEQSVIDIVKKASPAVVSIVVTKEMPVYEDYLEKKYEDLIGGYRLEYDVQSQRQKGTEVRKIGGGSGFFVSKDGLILTNRHVINDNEAEYTVITNDGTQYSATVVGIDPFQDLAVLKIESESTELEFLVLKLGNSDIIVPGQTVIAIGNALGEFSNTISVGIISGLSRNITAIGDGISENLEDLIQTDAAINKGNSGGPLLNSKGEVIGINVAMAESAQSIGFAIPINKAKQDIASVKKFGEIRKPFLGVVYRLVDKDLQKELDLSVDYGAWIVKEQGKNSIIDDSAAQKAGLEEGDIILEIDHQKIDLKNSLAKLIQTHWPGDLVQLKILRRGEQIIVDIILGQYTSE